MARLKLSFDPPEEYFDYVQVFNIVHIVLFFLPISVRMFMNFELCRCWQHFRVDAILCQRCSSMHGAQRVEGRWAVGQAAALGQA
jgi:hypothetical protein